jgi:hypothetical protein
MRIYSVQSNTRKINIVELNTIERSQSKGLKWATMPPACSDSHSASAVVQNHSNTCWERMVDERFEVGDALAERDAVRC